jgi:CheY-like chemotaxis protein
MLFQFPDALLPILLTLGGGLAGYLIALRRWGAAIKSASGTLGKTEVNVGMPSGPGPSRSLLRRDKPPEQVADILLVDDSAVARAKLRKLFEPAGYRVHLACDGVEALAMLDRGRYALMITDLEMPKMDGVTLINTCLDRPQTACMPVLAISGHESLRAKFNECRRVSGVHRKPWVDNILLSHVAALVSARQGSWPKLA